MSWLVCLLSYAYATRTSSPTLFRWRTGPVLPHCTDKGRGQFFCAHTLGAGSNSDHTTRVISTVLPRWCEGSKQWLFCSVKGSNTLLFSNFLFSSDFPAYEDINLKSMCENGSKGETVKDWGDCSVGNACHASRKAYIQSASNQVRRRSRHAPVIVALKGWPGPVIQPV